MKSNKKLIKPLIIGLIATLSLAAVIFGFASTKDSNEKKQVRIGYFPNITHSQALVGKANGGFQKEFDSSAEVTFTEFNAGPAEVEALFAKQIDIGYIGPGPAINAFSKSNGDVKIIAGATKAGAILVSRKGLTIDNLSDLANKKIAVPQYGNTQDLALRAILKNQGLKDTTRGGNVAILQAENPDIKTLLDKGQIDLALVPEPWGTRLTVESGAKVVLDSNEIWGGKYPSAVVVARTAFIEENPELVEKFLKAHTGLTSYINRNKSEAIKTVNEQIKISTGKAVDDKVIIKAFTRLQITDDVNTDAVKVIADTSFDLGFIKAKPDNDKLFDLTFLRKILK